MPASYPFREYRCLRSLRISGFIPSLGVGNPHMCLLRPAMQCWNRPKGHANITAVDVPGFTAKLIIQEVREVILPEGPFLEIWIIFFLEGHGLEAVPSHRFDFEKNIRLKDDHSAFVLHRGHLYYIGVASRSGYCLHFIPNYPKRTRASVKKRHPSSIFPTSCHKMRKFLEF